MPDTYRIVTLGSVLREALQKDFYEYWLYHRNKSTFAANDSCLLLKADLNESEPDEYIPSTAVNLGYPYEGLDGSTINDISEGARQFEDPPPEQLLLEAYVYYFRFDAFLPQPGAPDPPPIEESQFRLDREFLEKLGAERADSPCKKEGCSRGAVRLSVLCRRHHFEMVWKRECPFPEA